MKNSKRTLLIYVLVVISLPSFCQTTGTMTDSRDGQTYKTIKFGTVTWLAENLNFKTNNGSLCYNDEDFLCDRYGRLYLWDVAIYVCPEGWRLPSAQDWLVLQNHLGFEEKFSEDQYSYYFSIGRSFSEGGNQWLDLKINEDPDCGKSGFNARPGGYAFIDKSFSAIRENAYWWTASSVSVKSAFSVVYSGYRIDLTTNHYKENYYFNVRCVKN